MMHLSNRALHTPSAATRRLVPYAMQAQAKGIQIYYINIGQPDLETPKKILSQYASLSLPTIKYAPSGGMPETVAAWQVFYEKKGISFQKDQIVVTSGGAEGLMFAFFAVCDPGDELLVPEPYYTSYATLATMGGVTLCPIPTSVEHGFHLPSLDSISSLITEKTKGIIICNPNNPTGTVYTSEEVSMIVDIVKRHNLFLISDETYQEIVFDQAKVIPFSSFPDISQQLIIVDSLSKRLNVCGARVGCVASLNNEIMTSILKFAQGRLSVATVDQLAIVPMLNDPGTYIHDMIKIYQSRRDVVVQSLKSIPGITFSVPEGAFYLIISLPIDDSDAFATYLLTDFSDAGETVMVTPGTGFYSTKDGGKKEIRIAYVLEEKKLSRAIELLAKGLSQYLSSHPAS